MHMESLQITQGEGIIELGITCSAKLVKSLGTRNHMI